MKGSDTIGGIQNDLGKSTDHKDENVKIGKRATIDGKVHEWNGKTWKEVKDLK